jgi:hypothetical protein
MGVNIRKKFMIALLLAGSLLATTEVNAESDPVLDFFRRLGNSIAHPQTHPRPASKRNKKQSTGKSASSPAPSASPAAAAAGATPTPFGVRTASAAPAARGAKRDVPYGIPVPGKPGFVTSPFAPDAGFVDVRQFSPGTEVKDPYSGKIFLTP